MGLGPLAPRHLARRLTVQRPFSGFPARLIFKHTPSMLRASFMPRRGPATIYGSVGPLQVRLARNMRDLRRAQRLRYHVFYEEMSAIPADAKARLKRRDEDAYDAMCDHLLVVDTGPLPVKPKAWYRPARVVGTYRLLRQDVAEQRGGFYTQGEYDIAPLVKRKSPRYRFMEVGRSCVLNSHRNKRTLELLWHGLWTYVREHKIDVMLGCASFEGTDPEAHAEALSFLYHYALAPEDWRVRAHAGQHVELNMMPKSKVDPRRALKALPPLIKGYLRLGAFIGDGAVIDRQFNTVDVCIILPVEKIDPKYFAHFGAPDEKGSRIANGSTTAGANGGTRVR